MNKTIFMAAVFSILIIGQQAFATETAIPTTAIANLGIAPATQNCKMVETISIGVNFSNVTVEIGGAKSFMDSKVSEIQTLATDSGLPTLELQNTNYNVYAYNNTGCMQPQTQAQYQLSGNIAFNLTDADKAATFVKKLGEKGYNVNLNSSAYRQCQ